MHPEADLLADLVSALPQGIVLCDAKGRILLVNEAAARLMPGVEGAERFGAVSSDRNLDVTPVALSGATAYVVAPAGAPGPGRPMSAPLLASLQAPVQAPLRRPVPPPATPHQGMYRLDDILTRSPTVQELKRLAGLAAAADAMPVLLLGESGTGKELFAQAIHQASPRRSGPFVAVNCASVPESLLEAEFFGYAEGAFTGARRGGKPGLFQRADGGTLFLDEVSEMAPSLQAKLLRAIQNREVERVGGTRSVPVNVRILAASNRDLPALSAAGGFRPDLYYRLSVMTLRLPPLRSRGEDIPLLVRALLSELTGGEQPEVAIETLRLMEAYTWPGNVRELRNVLERAVALRGSGVIRPDDLPPEVAAPARRPSNYREHMEAAEREAVKCALQQAGGNRSRAARLLGISRSGLYEKMRELEVE